MKNPRHDLYSSRLVTSLEILHASKRKHQKTSMPLKSGSKPPRTLTLRRNVAGGVWSTTFCPLGGGIPTRIAVGMMGWWWVDVINFFLWKSEIWEIRHLYFEIWDPPNFFLTLDPKNLLCICYYKLLFGDWKSRNCSSSQVVDSWVCLTQAAKRCHESNGGFKGANGAGWSGEPLGASQVTRWFWFCWNRVFCSF